MQYCRKCKVKIRGRKECCPLCNSHLYEVEGEANFAFPVLEKRKIYSYLCFSGFTELIYDIIKIIKRGKKHEEF